ncbi:hypothetical protein CFC21_087087 [Triticum aestivum]|uniref:Uncharacterized protein n=3 Tax=Triticum TaxID=4564 RepID=A0A9R1B7V2_TRITD|nr:hypothetical protein CFC21_087087 [Triticum aestivum]VAI54711.1 unnamed protein product [Triticum turgidum subsp. durum]
MGLQEMAKLQLHRHGGMRVEAHAPVDDDQAAVRGRRKKATAAAVWIAVPLRPVKVGRRRHGGGDSSGEAGEVEEKEVEEEEEVTTPRGEGCRIPWEAATCPPAPKKARTAVAIFADRRCNRDDGEATEYFRVPADLDSVFAVSRVAEAN